MSQKLPQFLAVGLFGLLLAGPAAAQSLRFKFTTAVSSEASGSLSVAVSITNPGAAASTVEVEVVAGLSTATAGTDFTFSGPQRLTFPAGSSAEQTLTIPLTDDGLAEAAEYVTLRLRNPTNATLEAGKTEMLVYLNDNDGKAPAQSRNILLTHLGSYQDGASGTNSAEIIAHDPGSRRLFVANSVGGKLDILSLANAASPVPVASIDIKPYGNINSVAVRGGIVACAIENAAPQQNGFVVLFDQDGKFLQQVTVGALPDMVTFSPDGKFIITANEGEPNDAYTQDPEGSVSVIDFSGGVAGLTQASVTTVGFTSYNGQAAQLRQQGIRIFGGPAGTPSSVAQDLEPEYVAVSADSRTAYITLQENNAMATLDLTTRQFTALRSLGYQDHRQAGFALDASDQTPGPLLANWPIKGMRQPDALAAFEVGGQRYLITANEGDAREYTGFSEVGRLGASSYKLDETAFPNAALLKNNQVLGRLNVTNQLGDTDGDGDFDEIYAFGGRSFSIFNASTGALVHDSGDLLERLTSTDAGFGAIFNASNSTGAPVAKNRSDDKGPEPRGRHHRHHPRHGVRLRIAGAHWRGGCVQRERPGRAPAGAVPQQPQPHRWHRRPGARGRTLHFGRQQPQRATPAAAGQRSEQHGGRVRHSDQGHRDGCRPGPRRRTAHRLPQPGPGRAGAPEPAGIGHPARRAGPPGAGAAPRRNPGNRRPRAGGVRAARRRWGPYPAGGAVTVRDTPTRHVWSAGGQGKVVGTALRGVAR